MSVANIREKSDSTSSGADKSDNACVVCFKDVEIYSIGECDHPVCYECSTRMRVLCQQLECPICRQELGKVVFTYDKLSYRELEAKNRSEYYNQKYKISFYTKSIQQAFYNLLDHPCPKCDHPGFRKFEGLCNHVRRKHDLYYCDLCTDNLKIFSFERRCYTKSELSLHRRTGDLDNKSHRGHPLCEYCDTRYLDRDELFRHLRKDHYFCHFCDADGFNEFYKDYNSLREHFRKDHFLCEEGDCAKEEFTGAFRDEIDYKAHVANVHGQLLNKQQAKQTRTLKLEITLGPRGRSGQSEPHIASLRSRGRNDNHEEEHENMQPLQPQRALEIDARNEQEFPSLGGVAPSTLTLMHPPMSMRTRMGSAGLARTKENFPALGGTESGGGGSSGSASRPKQTSISSVIKKNTPSKSNAGMLIHVSNRPGTGTGAANKKPNPSNKSDFPSLPGTSKAAALAAFQEDLIPSNSNINFNNVSAKHRQLVDDYVSVANPSNFQKIQLVQKEAEEAKAKKAISTPKLDSMDFPALALGSKPSASTAAPSWTKSQKQRETDNRKSKVAPAPLLNAHSRQKNSKYAQNGSNGNSNANTTTTDKDASKKEKKNKNNMGEGKKSPEAKSAKQKKESNNNENKPAIANVSCEQMVNGNEDACQKEYNLPESNSSSYVPRVVGPPPGFSTTIKPPPGFQNVTLNSVAKLPNNLTFTNSLGENYNIIPTHNYIQPPESMTRNQKLVGHFKEALQTPEALEEFRQISQKFREGTYKAQPYYEHCQAALKDKFEIIFPELLSLLPDITKQQALFLVHSQHLKSKSVDQRKLLPNLEVCSTCKQVLLPSDADSHKKLHTMRNNFPTLGNSVCNKGNALTTSRK